MFILNYAGNILLKRNALIIAFLNLALYDY